MTTHPFLPSYLDRSECEQCGQPRDYAKHTSGVYGEPEPRELRESSEDFPRNVSDYRQSQGIRSPKNT